MQSTTVQAEIRQLESYRQQAFWWRTGAIVLLVAIVGISLAQLNSSVRGLAETGAAQDEFVAQFSQGMQTQVMPNVQTMASQTLTEIQPQLMGELNRLNTRVPELSDAFLKEFQTLQTELPKNSEKTLDDAFGKLLTSREAKIRQMYPDVTEEQVDKFVKNLVATGETEIRSANDELFSPHQAALAGILEHMEAIRNSEAANTRGQDPSWEMGLAVLDLVRDDLKDLKPADSSGTSSTSNASKAEVKK